MLTSDVNMRILMGVLFEMSGEAGVIVLEDLFWGAGVVVDADVDPLAATLLYGSSR